MSYMEDDYLDADLAELADAEFCDFCGQAGHTFRSCPRRDDE